MRFSRAFLAAVFLAAGTIIQNPKDLQSWSAGLAIVAAAASGGVVKKKEGP
jgi:hypothetical protein